MFHNFQLSINHKHLEETRFLPEALSRCLKQKEQTHSRIVTSSLLVILTFVEVHWCNQNKGKEANSIQVNLQIYFTKAQWMIRGEVQWPDPLNYEAHWQDSPWRDRGWEPQKKQLEEDSASWWSINWKRLRSLNFHEIFLEANIMNTLELMMMTTSE